MEIRLHYDYRQALETPCSYIGELANKSTTSQTVETATMMVMIYITLRSLFDDKLIRGQKGKDVCIFILPGRMEEDYLRKLLNGNYKSQDERLRLFNSKPNWVLDAHVSMSGKLHEGKEVYAFAAIEEGGRCGQGLFVSHLNTKKGWYFGTSDSATKHSDLQRYVRAEEEGIAYSAGPSKIVFGLYLLINTVIETYERDIDELRIPDFYSCDILHSRSAKVLSMIEQKKRYCSRFIVPFILEQFLRNLSFSDTEMIGAVKQSLKARVGNVDQLEVFTNGVVQVHKVYKVRQKKDFGIGNIFFFGEIQDQKKLEDLPLKDETGVNEWDKLVWKISNLRRRKNKRKTEILSEIISSSSKKSKVSAPAEDSGYDTDESDTSSSIKSWRSDNDFMQKLTAMYGKKYDQLADARELTAEQSEMLKLLHEYEVDRFVGFLDGSLKHKPYVFSFEFELLKTSKDSKSFPSEYAKYLRTNLRIEKKDCREFIRKRAKYLKSCYGKFTVDTSNAECYIELKFSRSQLVKRIYSPMKQAEIMGSHHGSTSVKKFKKSVRQLGHSDTSHVMTCNLTSDLFRFMNHDIMQLLTDEESESEVENPLTSGLRGANSQCDPLQEQQTEDENATEDEPVSSSYPPISSHPTFFVQYLKVPSNKQKSLKK